MICPLRCGEKHYERSHEMKVSQYFLSALEKSLIVSEITFLHYFNYVDKAL